MEDFLAACANGNEDGVKNCISQGVKTSVCDANGNNGAHLAVLNGHWGLAWKLIRFYQVSPYKINDQGDSIYHSIIKASLNHPPTHQSFSEFYQIQQEHWNNAIQKRAQKIQEIAGTTNVNPSQNMLAANYDSFKDEMFGNPYFTLPLYILNKYNVSIRTKNSAGLTPEALARELNAHELAEFFKVHDGEGKRFLRLMASLNNNLLIEVAIYL